MDYERLEEAWKRKRKDLSYKKLGWNSRLEKTANGTFELIYYSTVVMKFFENGEIEICPGDYWIHFQLTRNFINSYVPMNCYLGNNPKYKTFTLSFFNSPEVDEYIYRNEIRINKEKTGIVKRKRRKN